MATLNFSVFILFFFSSLILFSTYFYTSKNIVFLDKTAANLNLSSSYQKIFFVNFFDLIPVFICSGWIFIFTLYPLKSFFIFIFFSICCLAVSNYSLQNLRLVSIHDYILPLTLPVFIFFLVNSKTYLHFLFFLELVGYSFYFQFVTTQGTRKLTRLIDLYLFYYWSSFIGTIFLFLVGYKLLVTFNTTNYGELQFFSQTPNLFISFFFTTGFLVKIGAAGVHFLKADFYKYISVSSILNFSVLSVLSYIIIFNFFINLNIYFFVFPPAIFLFLTGGLLFFVFNIKHINNLALFFGYSGVITTCIALLVLV